MRKMLNVNLTLPLFQRLSALAEKRGLTVTDLIRRAVENFLRAEEASNGG